MANGEVIRKDRSQYLIKTEVEGNERIVVNATQVITPEGIAQYVGAIGGGGLGDIYSDIVLSEQIEGITDIVVREYGNG